MKCKGLLTADDQDGQFVLHVLEEAPHIPSGFLVLEMCHLAMFIGHTTSGTVTGLAMCRRWKAHRGFSSLTLS